MKEENIENIIDIVHEILELTGNPYLVEIFNKFKGNNEKLYKALKDYIRGIFYEVYEENDSEEDEKKSVVIKYIYINGVVIDAGNISRIELDSDYNSIKNKNNYYIRIVKKYPSPLEEEYIISFNSEEERDKGYEILKAKLKMVKMYIV